MSDAAREMTLAEYVAQLPKTHRARREYNEMREQWLHYRADIATLLTRFPHMRDWFCDNTIDEIAERDWSEVFPDV